MRTARSSFRSAVAARRFGRSRRSRSRPAPRRRATPAAASTSEDACADITTVTDGTITVGTSDPAFPPYVIDNNPKNGKGFESATAYAVARRWASRRPGRLDLRRLQPALRPG